MGKFICWHGVRGQNTSASCRLHCSLIAGLHRKLLPEPAPASQQRVPGGGQEPRDSSRKDPPGASPAAPPGSVPAVAWSGSDLVALAVTWWPWQPALAYTASLCRGYCTEKGAPLQRHLLIFLNFSCSSSC